MTWFCGNDALVLKLCLPSSSNEGLLVALPLLYHYLFECFLFVIQAASVVSLISYRAESLNPAEDNWDKNLHQLLERYFRYVFFLLKTVWAFLDFSNCICVLFLFSPQDKLHMRTMQIQA